jgi:hypothetical protein
MSRTPVEVVALSDLVESTPTRNCAYGSWDGRLRVSPSYGRGGQGGAVTTSAWRSCRLSSGHARQN